MRASLQRLREFLERNKIFFETIAALLLSIMATIVAVVQAWVAANQTALMALQTRVAEVAVLPQFEIGGYASNEGDASWVIENKGAPIHDYIFDVGCFLTVESLIDGERKIVQLPVHDCLGSWTAAWGGSGVIARVSGFHKTTEVSATEQRIMQAARDRHFGAPKALFEVVVHLRYRDLLERQHESFYATSTFNATRAIADAEGVMLMNKWRPIPSRFHFAELTSDRVLNLLTPGHR